MESIIATNEKVRFLKGEPVNEEGFVICACGCGRPTTAKAGTPVYRRHFDVEGAGTLREECWNRIYGVKKSEPQPESLRE